jgi:Ca-activated chloride channel family protein
MQAALPDGPPREAARRVILLTDGHVNAGETRRDVIVRAVADAAGQVGAAVTTACLGLGEDFNEVLLSEMSTQGRGAFVFVENADQIPAAMAHQVGDVLDVVARSPELCVAVSAGARVELLANMPSRLDGGLLRVRLPDLTADQELDVLFALHVDAGVATAGLEVRLACDGHAPCAATHTVAAGTEGAVAAEAVDVAVLEAAARRIAAAGRQAAVRAQSDGNYGLAAGYVRDAGTRVGAMRPQTPETMRIARELAEQAHDFARPMASHVRKSHMHASDAEMTDRTFEGTSRKRRS